MYKNLSPESVPAMPMVPSAQTFNLDIPENKSTMTTWNRTFIPMQLRTQPSNLPPSQLQRMNTTLGEQAKGVQFKRVEALTRSKTVIDLKQNPPTLAEQAERFPITQSANIKGRTSPHLKGSKGLMRSPSAHYKEPDSMLLKKSWSSHEGTQLSARWSGIPVPQGSQSQAKVTSRQQSWCSNLYFTIGNPCMISLCYCQNLWKHPGFF